jgi:dTDP-4-dehydrorhamnose reductase
MKILITGGSGLLGSNLIKLIDKSLNEVITPSSKDLDIRSAELVSNFIELNKPDIVIHCAAIAKFADAENRPIDTIEVNIIGTCNMVGTCMKNNIRFVYISTSHVFDGQDGNYKPTDKVNPLTKYSKSKVGGEMASLIYENSLVIRTEFCEETFPFDTAYTDKFSSKEYIDILAPKILDKCLGDEIGICHVGGPRRSFYEFGKLRNENVKMGSVKDLVLKSKVPILIDTSFSQN